MKRQSHQSYLLHPDGDKWSLFTPAEVMNLLEYPDWYQFNSDTPLTAQYQILGNSVNCKLTSGIASKMIAAMMEYRIRKQVEKEEMGFGKEISSPHYSIAVEDNGQLGFLILKMLILRMGFFIAKMVIY